MIKNLNYITFKEATSKELVLVDYWADWCAPCIAQNPILKEIAQEVEAFAKVYKVDINDNRVIADQQKVRNIPTLILYKNGIEIHRFAGISSKEMIINNIKQNIQKR